jgi:hypothetical protein
MRRTVEIYQQGLPVARANESEKIIRPKTSALGIYQRMEVDLRASKARSRSSGY